MVTNHAPRVAANVRAELARSRVKQSEIADVLHLSRNAISRRMAGKVEFNVTELYVISELCGVPVSGLLGEPVPA